MKKPTNDINSKKPSQNTNSLNKEESYDQKTGVISSKVSSVRSYPALENTLENNESKKV